MFSYLRLTLESHDVWLSLTLIAPRLPKQILLQLIFHKPFGILWAVEYERFVKTVFICYVKSLIEWYKHFSKSISIPNHDIFGRMLYGFFDVNSEIGIS